MGGGGGGERGAHLFGCKLYCFTGVFLCLIVVLTRAQVNNNELKEISRENDRNIPPLLCRFMLFVAKKRKCNISN